MEVAKHGLAILAVAVFLGCTPSPSAQTPAATTNAAPSAATNDNEVPPPGATGKPVVYQVFTRLFGNTRTTNKPWGTIEENGVGKFNDFTDAALAGIRELGVTHIWYTGVPHHALIRDYTAVGISNDDPDVVKGRAGSPYAVKDYYSVSPDLAEDPVRRLEEFQALVERTHRHGMKVLIDIVPNHVARRYESLAKPDGVEDFGTGDDIRMVYSRANDFYYVVGEDFEVPEFADGYRPLGGESHPLADGRFLESPAKWTGNGSRRARPRYDDWYETVRMNYGVKPDGSHDFPRLPEAYAARNHYEHHAFWRTRDVPGSWKKFRDIVLYWMELGVDGFRFDMAELVPVEFWSYLNSSIKMANPGAFLLAEVYQPQLYRDYIRMGKMDYLYDKVGFYDTIRPIMQGTGSTDDLHPAHATVLDIEEHMLHFLENHDEQRIASPGFAGDADRGRPGMVVSATISRAPTMVYFGQEVGERGDGDPGFGAPTRTTIFDYWGVPAHQRWMNGGKFDGGALSDRERDLREFYRRLLNFSASNPAMQGGYAEIHSANRSANSRYNDQLFAFVRWQGDERLIIVANFSAGHSHDLEMVLPNGIIGDLRLDDGRYFLREQLYGLNNSLLEVSDGHGRFRAYLAPLESLVLRIVPGS